MEKKVTLTEKEMSDVLVECIANEIALYRLANEKVEDKSDLYNDVFNTTVKILNRFGSAVIANVMNKVFAKKEEKKNGK